MKAWGMVHKSLCTSRVLSQYKRKYQSKTLPSIHCSLSSQWLNFFQSMNLNVWRRGCRSCLFDWIYLIFHIIQNVMQVKIYFWMLDFFGYRLFGQIQLCTKRKSPNKFNLRWKPSDISFYTWYTQPKAIAEWPNCYYLEQASVHSISLFSSGYRVT